MDGEIYGAIVCGEGVKCVFGECYQANNAG